MNHGAIPGPRGDRAPGPRLRVAALHCHSVPVGPCLSTWGTDPGRPGGGGRESPTRSRGPSPSPQPEAPSPSRPVCSVDIAGPKPPPGLPGAAFQLCASRSPSPRRAGRCVSALCQPHRTTIELYTEFEWTCIVGGRGPRSPISSLTGKLPSRWAWSGASSHQDATWMSTRSRIRSCGRQASTRLVST